MVLSTSLSRVMELIRLVGFRPDRVPLLKFTVNLLANVKAFSFRKGRATPYLMSNICLIRSGMDESSVLGLN